MLKNLCVPVYVGTKHQSECGVVMSTVWEGLRRLGEAEALEGPRCSDTGP